MVATNAPKDAQPAKKATRTTKAKATSDKEPSAKVSGASEAAEK